jgi:glycosyltransferase involved in cell wall biosynthesis
MVVAEAMLLGCVPLVARAGPMIEIVGDTGVVTRRSVEHVAAAILQLAEADLASESDRARAQAKAFAHGWDDACRLFNQAVTEFAGVRRRQGQRRGR